jgi:hypothetical protein
MISIDTDQIEQKSTRQLFGETFYQHYGKIFLGILTSSLSYTAYQYQNTLSSFAHQIVQLSTPLKERITSHFKVQEPSSPPVIEKQNIEQSSQTPPNQKITTSKISLVAQTCLFIAMGVTLCLAVKYMINQKPNLSNLLSGATTNQLSLPETSLPKVIQVGGETMNILKSGPTIYGMSPQPTPIQLLVGATANQLSLPETSLPQVIRLGGETMNILKSGPTIYAQDPRLIQIGRNIIAKFNTNPKSKKVLLEKMIAYFQSAISVSDLLKLLRR